MFKLIIKNGKKLRDVRLICDYVFLINKLFIGQLFFLLINKIYEYFFFFLKIQNKLKFVVFFKRCWFFLSIYIDNIVVFFLDIFYCDFYLFCVYV